MQRQLAALGIVALAVGGYLTVDYFTPGAFIAATAPSPESEARAETPAERIEKARLRSRGVKGVYMTAGVANDRGRAATKLREDIIALLATTELNAVVIDVKETEGGMIATDELRGLIRALHDMDAWVIARQVVFKDSSQEAARPEWYLKRAAGASPSAGKPVFWRDRRGGSWLDPASREVWAYQLAVAQAASDAGFDEIQFDYIRFPSDGNLATIVYPVYDNSRPKHEVMREFFEFLHDGLKTYRPELILSADLFGYVAIHRQDLGIGQRLEDIGENFDYISLMVYPSHYYAGFEMPADPARNLAAVSLPYRAIDNQRVAVSHPYEVVYRSLLAAADALAGKATTTGQIDKSSRLQPGLGEIDQTATSTVSPVSPTSSLSSARRTRLRPWLQDFNLAVDSSRGIYYDAAKVRAQIDAAEAAGSSGWLLWNSANVYTKEALKLE